VRRHLILLIVVLLLTGALSLISQTQAVAGLAARYQKASDSGYTALVLAPVTTAPDPGTNAHLLEAKRVIDYRLEKLGVSAAGLVNLQEGKLEVTLPEGGNTPYVINIITSIGKIEFIDGGESDPPIGQRILTGPHARPNRSIYRSLFTGADVESVLPPDPATGQIFYSLALKPAAAQRFGAFVMETPRNYVCMVLDERVINCSRMYHFTGEGLEILPDLGSGTQVSLADLAVFLEGGPLPLALDVRES
jgi:preprotein translocase subunit SecD